MHKSKKEVVEVFREISATALWNDELPISIEDYEALISTEDTEALLNLIETESDDVVESIPTDYLMTLPFSSARKLIARFSLAKRIGVLDELAVRRSYLYSQAARYGDTNLLDSEPLSTKDWTIIMGKIKHLEIIQAWLYGI